MKQAALLHSIGICTVAAAKPSNRPSLLRLPHLYYANHRHRHCNDRYSVAITTTTTTPTNDVDMKEVPIVVTHADHVLLCDRARVKDQLLANFDQAFIKKYHIHLIENYHGARRKCFAIDMRALWLIEAISTCAWRTAKAQCRLVDAQTRHAIEMAPTAARATSALGFPVPNTYTTLAADVARCDQLCYNQKSLVVIHDHGRQGGNGVLPYARRTTAVLTWHLVDAKEHVERVWGRGYRLYCHGEEIDCTATLYDNMITHGYVHALSPKPPPPR